MRQSVPRAGRGGPPSAPGIPWSISPGACTWALARGSRRTGATRSTTRTVARCRAALPPAYRSTPPCTRSTARCSAGSLSETPQGFSYFRYGSGDHGALNSEFFVSLRVAPRVRVRGGASHYVTNYTVTDTAAVGAPNSRYQKFQTVPFIAVRLQL